VFGFVREEYEKTLRTTGLLYPIHVHQGSPKYGRGAKSILWSHFIRPQRHFVNNEKIY